MAEIGACKEPPDAVLHDAVKVEWSGSSDPSGVRCISVTIGDVRVSDTGTWLTTGAAINCLTSGLRALNDAPMPTRRIWVNFYIDGASMHFSEKSARKTGGAALFCAVPFVEEKP